jgi:hypothetical protein
MNWNYWLPWRDYPQNDSEDLIYEDEVIRRCDHDFNQTTTLQSSFNFREATIEEGFIVVPQYELVEEFCEKCGEPGIAGEPSKSYRSDGHIFCNGKWRRVARRLAFKPTFEIDPNLTVSDAIAEPVEAPADYKVDGEGDVTKVDNDDGSGRVLVNQSEEASYGVTD